MKNVIFTGSTRGLGFAMAKEFLKQNCPHESMSNTDAEYIDSIADTNIKGVMYVSEIAVVISQKYIRHQRVNRRVHPSILLST